MAEDRESNPDDGYHAERRRQNYPEAMAPDIEPFTRHRHLSSSALSNILRPWWAPLSRWPYIARCSTERRGSMTGTSGKPYRVYHAEHLRAGLESKLNELFAKGEVIVSVAPLAPPKANGLCRYVIVTRVAS
ncbi:hypothetical protein ACQKQD_31470 [Methylobacterium sp. NPDC080182]|uniref:hypothetical protein n=1 Tax=Methylobacterium sp. NPDC080182 TaxID=3390590 RepID=UPI003D0526A0